MGVISSGHYALCGIGEQVPDLVFGEAGKDSLEEVWRENVVLKALTRPACIHLRVWEQDRVTPETTRFVVSVGPSMNPTLRDPEILEIRPSGNGRLRVGDVVYFQARSVDQPLPSQPTYPRRRRVPRAAPPL